jgi:hypothetical protein
MPAPMTDAEARRALNLASNAVDRADEQVELFIRILRQQKHNLEQVGPQADDELETSVYVVQDEVGCRISLLQKYLDNT